MRLMYSSGMDVLSIAVESLSLSGSLVSRAPGNRYTQRRVPRKGGKVGKGDFGEIFDGYVPNLIMLLRIRNSSHWYGGEVC